MHMIGLNLFSVVFSKQAAVGGRPVLEQAAAATIMN